MGNPSPAQREAARPWDPSLTGGGFHLGCDLSLSSRCVCGGETPPAEKAGAASEAYSLLGPACCTGDSGGLRGEEHGMSGG